MLPALHRCRPTVSKGARRIVDQAKIALSAIAPATKSLLRSSRCHRPRQSTHLPPKPPHRQIPIVTNRQPGGPRVPSWEAFGRRPSERARPATTGPASETLHRLGRSGLPSGRSASGHKERFAPSRLSGRVGFRKRPFAPDNRKTRAGWAAALLLYRLGPLVRGSNLIALG